MLQLINTDAFGYFAVKMDIIIDVELLNFLERTAADFQ